MARVGHAHEAVDWCLRHIQGITASLLLEVGSAISEAEGPSDVRLNIYLLQFWKYNTNNYCDQVIAYAAFRLGILALHKTLRREYAPSTRPELAVWLIRTLSTVGIGLDSEQVGK